MSTKPLRTDTLEDGIRPRDWQPRRSNCKVPFRLLRLCVLGILLPTLFIIAPLFMRYRKYSEQLYPLTISDQRLIDGKVSTIWCQSQIVRANATFNAYLLKDEPVIEKDAVPVSMTRHLILEDDMKEYWGFYLLHGSSVTVSTCVRWPGASLTIIRGHKHLHECAFIGDDSSEELEELLEVAQEQGLLNTNKTTTSFSNVPEKMGRAGQHIHFHHEGNALRLNLTKSAGYPHHTGSHELDDQAMRNILAQLFAKTFNMKKKKENPHHHYKGVFRDFANIDKPPTATPSYSGDSRDQPPEQKSMNRFNNDERISESSTKIIPLSSNISPSFEEESAKAKKHRQAELEIQKNSKSSVDHHSDSTLPSMQVGISTAQEIVKKQEKSETGQVDSAEVFQDVLRKISSLGDRGKQMLRKLMDEIDARGTEGDALRQLLNETMNDKELSIEAKKRRKRDLVLSSPLYKELTQDDEDGDTEIEEGMLHPDGIAEDRGTVNETTLYDRSNSEFWSSFSSSEERLLECKGLILNLPLTPHRHCTPRHESQHSAASIANTVTYRVPVNGYYFFVFNSENEIQPNYVRVRFDLLKTVYNTSDPVHVCKNSTKECSLPFRMFSSEKTVLELPLSGNDSQWNEEYIVVSTCEPRTMVYVFCIIMVQICFMCCAFH